MDNHNYPLITQSPSPRARRTLGFLAGNLHMDIAPRLWPGMIAAAWAHDVNLFCFPGGSLHPVGEFDPERSAIYNLVDVDRFDGPVGSGATAPGGPDPERATAFLRRYHPLPIVSLARLPGEIPHVTMNSYQGMQAVMLHLIQTHGLHRRAQRLCQQTERTMGKLKAELDNVEVDENGQAVRSFTTQVLDVRKLTLLNLFRTHAMIALHLSGAKNLLK
jgi:DNA-binding LacI/PurR family transcriptional regulator